jgi:hypothetical protein
MFRKNQRHLQPALMSDLDHLTAKQRQRLQQSWASVFRREVFERLDESAFAVLYSDTASRPNIPVNVLVGLETLKAGNNWSDENLHDAFSFDVQVRYALGYENLGEGEFDLRTIYNFRQRLSQHMQATGENLMARAFVQITDEQLATFQLRSGQLRMDSSQIASNIRQMSRLHLLVEVLQRVHRMLNPLDAKHYAETLSPYLQGSAGQYVYHIKGDQQAAQLQRLGDLMQRLVLELQDRYSDEPTYQILCRVFQEHFRSSATGIAAIPGSELSASSLLSPDDLEATFRKKGHRKYLGYVTNVTETCAPENPFQLIVQVQTAPNLTADNDLLVAVLPDLKARTGVETLYTDAPFCGPRVELALREHHVTQIPSSLCGYAPNPQRLNLHDFDFRCDAEGIPQQIVCPQGQSVAVSTPRAGGSYVARLDPAQCRACPLAPRCPSTAQRLDPVPRLRFTQNELDVARRRQRCRAYRAGETHLRAAIEAAIGALKRPFSDDQLPVRGRFRVGDLLLGSALMVNVRRIQRYLAEQVKQQPGTEGQIKPSTSPSRSPSSFLSFWRRRLLTLLAPPALHPRTLVVA